MRTLCRLMLKLCSLTALVEGVSGNRGAGELVGDGVGHCCSCRQRTSSRLFTCLKQQREYSATLGLLLPFWEATAWRSDNLRSGPARLHQ